MGCVWEWSGNVFRQILEGLGKHVRWDPKHIFSKKMTGSIFPESVRKVFEYDLYVSWLVAIEKRGQVRDIASARRRLGRGSWMERNPNRAALQNIVKTKAMYVPYYDFSPKWRCELPESVYLLFHRDRNTEQHRFGCCSRDWLAKNPSGRVPCGGMVAKGRRPPPPPKKPPVPPAAGEKPPVPPPKGDAAGVAKSVV